MYHFSTEVDVSFEEAIGKVTDALKIEGFGVLTDIDVQATLKAKIDVDRRPYRILGACNPKLANQAINHDEEIGLLLPCNVVVRENDEGKVIVSFMDPKSVLSLVGDDDVAQLAGDVRGRLKRVCDSL